MKVKLLLISLLIVNICGFGQVDSALFVQQQQQIESLQRETRSLRGNVATLTRQVETLKERLGSLTAEMGRKMEGHQTAIESLGNDINAKAESLANKSTMLEQRIDQSDQKTSDVQQDLHGKTLVGIFLAIGLLVLLALLFLLLRKRISKGDTAIEAISQAQKHLQKESVKLDSKLVALLESQMNAQSLGDGYAPPNHSLALKVADEITRIETNLSRMDQSVRGHKQLAASVKRIKDNFLSNGYELMDMLGKPYTEGMRANVDFVIDEDMDEGQRIITAVAKPQVNYKGEMIQKASITVSQNI